MHARGMHAKRASEQKIVLLGRDDLRENVPAQLVASCCLARKKIIESGFAKISKYDMLTLVKQILSAGQNLPEFFDENYNIIK